MVKKKINGIDCFLSEKLASIGAPHAFTTCRGGVSNGVFDSLNVSTRRKNADGDTDLYENTVENFRRVTSLVGASPENSVCAHQVHGNTVLELDETFCGMGILRSAAKNIDGDGLYTDSLCRQAARLCLCGAFGMARYCSRHSRGGCSHNAS